MNASIVTNGQFDENGQWILTRMTVVDNNDQQIVISLCENGTYDFSSLLIGDDQPVKTNVINFKSCWNAIPVLLGFVEGVS